jgi:hypothetical protein
MSELREDSVTKPKKKKAHLGLAESASSERYICNRFTYKDCDILVRVLSVSVGALVIVL